MKDIDKDFFIKCVKESKNCKTALNKMGYQLGKNTNICASTKVIFKELCIQYHVDTRHFVNTNPTIKTRKNLVCSKCGVAISNANQSGLCQSCKNEKRIYDWKNGVPLSIAPTSSVSKLIRNYIYKKQNYCCDICGMTNEWNNKELKFILDHIDGNASNNQEKNLRLICPNCDSQLDTYKSKNKNSARHKRRKKYAT